MTYQYVDFIPRAVCRLRSCTSAGSSKTRAHKTAKKSINHKSRNSIEYQAGKTEQSLPNDGVHPATAVVTETKVKKEISTSTGLRTDREASRCKRSRPSQDWPLSCRRKDCTSLGQTCTCLNSAGPTPCGTVGTILGIVSGPSPGFCRKRILQ